MKKSVSMFNPDSREKDIKIPKHFLCKHFLKPAHFQKFNNKTLFYIFYYMPRDSLQLFATEELYFLILKLDIKENGSFT